MRGRSPCDMCERSMVPDHVRALRSLRTRSLERAFSTLVRALHQSAACPTCTPRIDPVRSLRDLLLQFREELVYIDRRLAAANPRARRRDRRDRAGYAEPSRRKPDGERRALTVAGAGDRDRPTVAVDEVANRARARSRARHARASSNRRPARTARTHASAPPAAVPRRCPGRAATRYRRYALERHGDRAARAA